MTTLIDQRRTLIDESEKIILKAQTEGRDLTEAETKSVNDNIARLDDIDAQVAQAKKGESLLAKLGAMGKQLNAEGVEFFAQDGDTGFFRLTKSAEIGRRLAAEAKQYAVPDRFGRKALVGSGVVTTPVEFDTTIIAANRPAQAVLDVLPAKVRAVPKYMYLRQITRTNNAAVVAPGALKPTSVYTLEEVDGALSVIAHLSEPMDKYLLGDQDILGQFIATELGYGLLYAVEGKVLTDLAATSGIQTQAFVTDVLTTTRTAITKLENLGSVGGFWMLHPTDWQTIETTQDANDRYQMGPALPVDRAARRLWGVPAVVSNRATPGAAWLVAPDAAQLSTDGTVSLDWGMPGDTFSRNQLVARCEGRFNLDVMRPFGVVSIDLTA